MTKVYYQPFFRRSSKPQTQSVNIFRKRTSGGVSSNNPEPWDEGGGEGTERRPGLRGYLRTCSSYIMGSRHSSNHSRGEQTAGYNII